MEAKKAKMRTSATERMDRRYMLIENARMADVEKAIIAFSGVLGMSQVAPIEVDLKGYNAAKGQIVVAINRDKLTLVRAAFELGETEIAIRKVSGTLKGLFS